MKQVVLIISSFCSTDIQCNMCFLVHVYIGVEIPSLHNNIKQKGYKTSQHRGNATVKKNNFEKGIWYRYLQAFF